MSRVSIRLGVSQGAGGTDVALLGFRDDQGAGQDPRDDGTWTDGLQPQRALQGEGETK